jgi:hypothetical protein
MESIMALLEDPQQRLPEAAMETVLQLANHGELYITIACYQSIDVGRDDARECIDVPVLMRRILSMLEPHSAKLGLRSIATLARHGMS